MDAEPVFPLPGLPARGGGDRGVQREVHVQPVRPPRRLLRDAGRARPPDLPELLPAGRAMAVHGDTAGAVRRITETRGRDTHRRDTGFEPVLTACGVEAS